MLKQHELFQQQFSITPPNGVNEPRLWVRRFVVWKEPGGEIIQDVELRPGLNIVWTPDDLGIGHGGGKTLFCRLLRYCLGEDRFASEDQRERISSVFLNGLVGAEVILDGKPWAIVRPLGTRRRQYAVPDGDLDAIAASQDVGTGIEPFLDAVEQSIMTDDLVSLIPSCKRSGRAWPIALAWLTRDQECRFDHVLDWRSPMSNSESPVSGMNQTEKLDALRAFLLAMTPHEQELREKIATLDEQKRALEQEISHRKWESSRLRKKLIAATNISEDILSEGSMAEFLLRQAVRKKLSEELDLPPDADVTDLEEARAQFEAARDELSSLQKKMGIIEAEIPGIKRTISAITAEHPSLFFSEKEAENYPCPICLVPIDRVLAEGCGVSNKIPDLEACKRRLEKNKQDLEEEKTRLHNAESSLESFKVDCAVKQQVLQDKEGIFRKLNADKARRDAAFYSAKRINDEIDSYVELLSQGTGADTDLLNINREVEALRSEVGTLVEQQARAFSNLSEKFDPIIRYLVGEQAAGEVRVSSSRINLTVKMGGDRSTSAIESLKVVAFDLASMCMSIEGSTRVPAFLVHDSPREADLGLQLYSRLFHFARALEEKAPLFQYIVTTTTRPPSEVAMKPWVVMTLKGAPASERLLKQDL